MKSFLPALLVALIILALSIGPGVSMPQSWWDIVSWDKVGHLVFYGTLTYFLLIGADKHPSFQKRKFEIWMLLLSITYGITLECMQYAFFPNRYFEFPDIIANIIGSFIGLIFFKKLTTKIN